MTRILLAEDDIVLGNTIKDLLVSSNFEVDWVKNGFDALAILNKRPPDIVITDLLMPIMGGEELYERIRQNKDYNQIPVIILTANPIHEVKINNLEKGVNDYLIKPFSIKELILRVKNLLDYRTSISSLNQNYPFPNFSIGRNEKTFIQTVNEFLIGNINKDVSLDQLADYCNLSRSSVYKKILAYSGKNFSRYVREFRIDIAIYLIHKGNTNVKSLAFETGFKSISYFSVSFSNYKGMSPIEYIKSNVNPSLTPSP